ncbi:MAG TPA: hypothetical protein P5338_08335, partial [Bacteroidales bacterium]|nr:hypothetical protein [Bacteroidales bacterium]
WQITILSIYNFIDRKISSKNEQPTGGMGFFECINNLDAAFMLFDAARRWLAERGMEAMDGPVNFGDRDRWWGLLVEGFHEPNFCMPYNPPYYRGLFEGYGFQDYFRQYTYHRHVYDGDLDIHLKETADRIAANPRYRICHINRGNLRKYAEEFAWIYNHAWTRHGGVKEFSTAHAMALLKSLKPILDERLIWFAYYDDEPVGFLIMIPEMNQIFRYVNGKMDLLGKLKFLWYFKWLKRCSKALGLIFGFVEQHQRKGLEGAMVYAFRSVALAEGFPYREIELNWIGDFNPTMIRIVEMVGFKVRKTHITYRYLFDRTKPFTRAKKVS